MINKIHFKNYKSFKEEQVLEIAPITILIGKNSSGKSAIAKLPVLIDNSFNNVVGEPYTIDYNNVQFGGEYRDLFFERIPNAELEFKMFSEKGHELQVKIVSDFEKNTIPRIIYYRIDNQFEFIFNPETEVYTETQSGKNYRCRFDGFNIEVFNLDNDEYADIFMMFPLELIIKTDYVGPFRVYANEMRSFPLRSYKNINNVGVNGEQAYYILGIESLKSNSNLIESVSEWYKQNFEGWGIKVNNDLQPHCSVDLTREDKKFNINIADVGQGMSQALPLVVSAFLSSENQLTIIEQPELHLHPAAHGNLAELFCKSAIALSKKYLIETHSQNFVLRIRRLIAEKKFNHEDLKIYWVDYDGKTNSSSLKAIPVNEFGEVAFWPPNIFSETLDETIAIRTAQNERKNAG